MTKASGPILVGIDGSDDSISALQWAVGYAKTHDNPVHAIAVVPEELAVSDAAAEVEESLVAEARRILDQDAAVTYEVDTRVGKAAEQLVRSSADASMIVLGSRGHGAIAGLLIGSVSQHVARQAACPVVVVRESESKGATRVVAGTDGSEESLPALEWAFEYASAQGAELSVIYAFLTSAASPAVLSGYIPTNVGDEIAVAEQLVADVVAPLAERYPDVKVEREAIPVPAAVALAEASATASLVVVGSRGRGAFEGMLLGSVSQSLLHRAQCSVVIVR